MKFKSILVFILFITRALPFGYAVEAIPLEVPASSSGASESPIVKDFYALVTGDDQLALKPGPVFTDGGHYEGTQLPYLVSYPKPIRYPRWAQQQGWQGDLSIAIEILTDGSVGRYKVMQSTGHTILDEAATEAVKTWKFHPAMKGGQAIVTCIQIPVRFQIDSKE